MTEEESEKSYRSGLPGFLGVIDTAISKIESVILAMGVLLMALNTVTNCRPQKNSYPSSTTW